MSSQRTPSSANKRPIARDMAPAPMRVKDEIIALCREKVETEAKRRMRGLLLPLIRWRCGIGEAGEGFQWGMPYRGPGARLGRYCFIGGGFDAQGLVVIGDLTMISTGVHVVGDDHRHDDVETPMRIAFPTTPRRPTVIEADCWVGHSAIIKEGVTIRRGSVIAAGAVVTRNVEPYSVVGGVPGRRIRVRFGDEDIRKHDLMLYGRTFD